MGKLTPDELAVPAVVSPDDSGLIPGYVVLTEGVYVFECPLCRRRFRQADRAEPCCTGPSDMRDEHPFMVMRCLGRDARRVMI